ncbi:hypothetical protein [Paenibacillus sp. SN-8-1]|uniref:hypothetical protein n=1 Tax=Paenibacillus sp. SN-8-1 TaxID=3435409 RepID=UPI003D9A4533
MSSVNASSDNYETKTLSDKDIKQYYSNFREVMPETINKDYVGKIIDRYDLIRTEETKDEQGNRNTLKYYKVEYKNTPEGQSLKQKIQRNKMSTSSVGPTAVIKPEEGDIRINTTYTQLTERSKFDSVKKILELNLQYRLCQRPWGIYPELLFLVLY